MYSFWGKAAKGKSDYHLLVYHGLDVAAVLHEVLTRDSYLARRISLLAAMHQDRLNELLLFYAALHDLGKFSPAFQNIRGDIVKRLGHDPKTRCVDMHHTVIGQHLFEQHLIPNLSGGLCGLPPDITPDILAPLSSATFGHHGKPCPHEYGIVVPEQTLGASREFFLAAKEHFLPSGLVLPCEDDRFFKPMSWLFAGLLVLCDWIASGDNFAYVDTPMPLAEYWRDHAMPTSRKAVEACGILAPPVRRERGFHDLLPHLPPDAKPTPLQALALSDCERKPGQRLLIFEDVTGSGKTEAALLAAHGIMARGDAQGLYVGLPTMATANGMYARLYESYRALFEMSPAGPPSLMLAHGARGLHDDFLGSIGLERGRPSDGDQNGEESPDSGAFCSAWLADNRKKALLAPCGVGTLDQALLAVLPSRHQSLRLLGLGRNVLVADEVHAFDPYTTKLLENLVAFQAGLGGSVILLSATLPLAVKRQLVTAFCEGAKITPPLLTDRPLPLATRVDASGSEEIELPSTRTLEVAVEMAASREVAIARLVAVREAGGCAAFILNTVDRAVEAHDALSGLIPPEDLILFHARFAQRDRQVIEACVLSLFGKDSTPEDRKGKVLVATQVVEQSLDLDFDHLVTELAPMELIIQRAGRCQRHRRDRRPSGFERPSVMVLGPQALLAAGPEWGKKELGTGLFVYPMTGVLWRTARLLETAGRLEMPRDARRLVEGAYAKDDTGTPEALAAKDDKVMSERLGQRSVARHNMLEFGQGYGTEAADGWYDDRITPTRLGLPSVTLRLAAFENEELRLWGSDALDAKACALAEVSAKASRFDALPDPDDVWKERMNVFEAKLPDKGRWARLVPLERAESGEWRCALPGWEGVRYRPELGLRFGAEDLE